MYLDVPSTVSSAQLTQTGADLYAGLTGLLPSFASAPIWSGQHRFQGTTGGMNLTVIFGSDAGASTLTDDSVKIGTLSYPHITNGSQPIGAIHALSDGSTNYLKIGGNNGSLNTASTNIDFYTATGIFVIGGTRRGGFNRLGDFDLASGFSVKGPVALSGVATSTSANIGGAAIPATAVGFITINITGGNFKIPYFNL